MRVFLYSESHGWSGGAAQTLLLACGLKNRGHEVRLGANPEGELFRRATNAGLSPIPFVIHGDADPLAIRKLYSLISGHSADLYHAQHAKAHGIGWVLRTLWRNAPPFLVTRRVSFPIKRDFFSRRKYVSPRINGFIAVSKGIRDVLIEGGVDAAKIEVIYSGTPPEDFAVIPQVELQRLRESLGLRLDIPLIVKVANYSAWKGQAVLIEAARRLKSMRKNFQILFAGRDTDGAAFNGLVEKAGVADCVKGIGFRTDVAHLLSLATLSVNAAVEGEGLSGALRESLFLGIPAVASRVSGNAELLEEGKCGVLVPANDSAALAQALKHLLEHPAEAKQMADAGRHRVRQELTADVMVQKTEAFYQKILQNRCQA